MNRTLCKSLVAASLLLNLGWSTTVVRAEAVDPFVGQMLWVPFNFAPKGWSFCNGQLLPLSQNTALFSLLGTTYGGDGRATFALPDMQGRLMINAGQGPGLSNFDQGQSGGEENHTLSVSEIPAHSHTVAASNTSVADATSAVNNLHGQSVSGNAYGSNPSATMSSNALSTAGGGQGHNNMMPYATLNCIIALQGVFPPRN